MTIVDAPPAAPPSPTARRRSPRSPRPRILVAVVAAAVAVPMLMTLRIHWGSLTRTDAPLRFFPDRRLSMIAPEEEEEVRLPLEVRWEVTDFPIEEGNHFGVFVDTDIPSPDTTVRLRVCGTREQLPPAPGEFRGICKDQRETIFFTGATSFTIECFQPRFDLGARRLNDHRVSIILLDGENRRVGEAAASVPFRVDPDDDKKCRGL
jgi:hypothetical protein